MISTFGKRSVFWVIAFIFLAQIAAAAGNPVPYIYAPLVPAAAEPGGPGVNLIVRGTGFVPGAVVNWNGKHRETTYLSGSEVAAVILPLDIADAGTATVTVTNPPPGGGTSNAQYFQVTIPTEGLIFKDSILAAGVLATKVVVGDFNGDGKPDLVVLGYPLEGSDFSYLFQLMLGNGDGTFQSATTLFYVPVGIAEGDFVAADVNGDGKLDLVGTYQSFRSVPYDSRVYTLLGNGDGTFQPPIESDSNVLGSNAIVVADVNGDGIPDLVRACTMGVCVDLGNGDGTFRAVFTYTPPTPFLNEPFPAQTVAVGDFHKNGKLDIVTGFNGGPNAYFLAMLPSKGDGTFGPPSVIYEGGTSSGASSGGLDALTVADLYGEGRLDLVYEYYNPNPPQPASQANSEAVSSMRGNGDGTFQGPLTAPGLPSSYKRTPLVPGDFNGDGHLDLAAKSDVLLLWTGGGPDSYNLISSPTSSRAFAAADFNGDGRLDLVGIDDSQNIHVLVQAADFVGAINPSVQSLGQFGSTTFTITEESSNGFAGNIELSASGVPIGATITFTPSTIHGSGTSKATVTTNGTALGSYLILLSGKSGSITHTGGVRIDVGP